MTGGSRHVAVRTCVGCGKRAPQASMLRLHYDVARGLQTVTTTGPGRSAYLHREPECIRALAKSRLLKRSLRHNVDGDCRERLAAQLMETARVG